VSRKNKSFKQAAAEGPSKPERLARVVETRGSLTFDSYLCCEHRWVSVKLILGESPDLYTHGRLSYGVSKLKPGQKPEFEMVCCGCGAGATFGEVYGRRKVVAYDRDWNFSEPPPPPSRDEREEREAAKKIGQQNAPVAFEDALP